MRVRVKPRTFEDEWKEDFKQVGVIVPEKIPTTAYTPVNHNPMPFSVDVDLKKMRIVKRTVGVIPNAIYKGKIYNFEEFKALIGKGEKDG